MASKIPQVDKLLKHPQLQKWNEKLIPKVRASVVRKVLETARENIASLKAENDDILWIKKIESAYEALLAPAIIPAINATGIVLHTNLGRAPIGEFVLSALSSNLGGYCTLETDSETAARGERTAQLELMLCALTGAEAAVVVNNGAAAVFLMLNALSLGRKTLISRGELVQIGGGFRIPDILRQSGAHLNEVGTTNITELKDYQKAVDSETALILKVHQSCFHIEGHTHAPRLEALAELAHHHKIPLAVDWGSGSLKTRSDKELSIEEILASGCDLLSFSGDKLFGASQAGMIVGRRPWIEPLKKSPLYRALRLGKLDLFVLEDRIRNHLAGKPSEVEALLDIPLEALTQRSQEFSKRLEKQGIAAQIKKDFSPIGGGSTPDELLESCLLEIKVPDCETAARQLCRFKIPVYVRKEKGKVLLDLRTVFPNEEDTLLEALTSLKP